MRGKRLFEELQDSRLGFPETRRLLGAVSEQPSGVKRIRFQLMYKGICATSPAEQHRDQLPCVTWTFTHDITPGKHRTAATGR